MGVLSDILPVRRATRTPYPTNAGFFAKAGVKSIFDFSAISDKHSFS